MRGLVKLDSNRNHRDGHDNSNNVGTDNAMLAG